MTFKIRDFAAPLNGQHTKNKSSNGRLGVSIMVRVGSSLLIPGV